MQLGLIGLGRMGANIARRLMRHGHQAIVFDRDSKTVASLASDGAVGAAGIDQLVHKLSRPQAVWMMLPAGEITETAIAQLGTLLEAGDVILDGGNSFWKDDSGALGG
jgi:6-phosphogluconate dehydrogenase